MKTEIVSDKHLSSPNRIEAIVLAAGLSSRANDFKMTMQLGESTVLEATVSKFEGICEKVIVVGGFRSERIREAAAHINLKYSMDIQFVMNEHYEMGMFSSLQTGCKEVSAPYFFVTPGDCPLVQKKSVEMLAQASGDAIIPSCQYKGGHPIKLSNTIKTEILAASVDSNLRHILKAHEKHYVNVEDPGVLMDLDTPDDYMEAVQYYKNFY